MKRRMTTENLWHNIVDIACSQVDRREGTARAANEVAKLAAKIVSRYLEMQEAQEEHVDFFDRLYDEGKINAPRARRS